jgi:hypothetical protein
LEEFFQHIERGGGTGGSDGTEANLTSTRIGRSRRGLVVGVYDDWTGGIVQTTGPAND